jgi:hypothetical protein
MDLKGIGWQDEDWVDMALDKERWQAVVNTLMKHRIPESVENFLCSWETSYLKRTVVQNC